MTKSTLIHERVSEARNGDNPRVIGRMKSGWAVVGDHQIVFGYSLLLPDLVAPSLNDLRQEKRIGFLQDMALLGDALLQATGAKRINYEILGNSEPALHAHLFPRYDIEPEEYRVHPVWYYDWSNALPLEPEQQNEFVARVREQLNKLDALAPVDRHS